MMSMMCSMQGFGNEDLEEEGARGDEAEAEPAPGAAREGGSNQWQGCIQRRLLAQDKDGNKGQSQPVRLVKQTRRKTLPFSNVEEPSLRKCKCTARTDELSHKWTQE